jgi:hypothetical protein
LAGGPVAAGPVGRSLSTRCNNMDEAFNNWLKTPKADGGAGLAPGTPLDKTTYNMLMREYVKADSNFQPSIVTVTNPTTQAAEQAFMSSPNSAQLMRDTQPRVQYKPDKEGNLLAIEGTLANYVTNNTGERIKIDPKSNALADALAAMAGPQGAAPAESGGFLSGLFGGGAPVTNAPTPMPTPMATPAATPMATPMPAMAGTNAPVPALSTPEAVRAAFLAGQISEAQAVQMLRGGR